VLNCSDIVAGPFEPEFALVAGGEVCAHTIRAIAHPAIAISKPVLPVRDRITRGPLIHMNTANFQQNQADTSTACNKIVTITAGPARLTRLTAFDQKPRITPLSLTADSL